MNGYRYFMRNVKLSSLILFLIFGLVYQGYADCPPLVYSNTDLEATGNKTGKGLKNFFSFNWGSLDFDEKLLKYIRVTAIKDQGVDGYFNPKIQVCDYEGNDNCYALPSGTSCRQIYGTQSTGAGISAAVFIDWEGTGDGKFIRKGEAQGLEWEWAENVTKEEQKRFAKSPKICACSQKGACMSGVSAYFARVTQGENIFRPGEMESVCDTCYQGKVKCVPIPLAPGPPPFCEQLAMSPPQVRVVPITNNDNDYFNPKVSVMISELQERKYLDFPNKENITNEYSISDDKGTTYYFKTYREKNKLCAEYHGTKSIDGNKNLEFTRCFPAPPAPQPEIVRIVDQSTLEIKMKMSRDTCTKYGRYDGASCIFNIYYSRYTPIGPLSLKVVKPAIVEKTADSSNSRSDIDDILEKILDESKDKDFKILKKYGYVPDIKSECKEFDAKGKCKFENSGQPKIEVEYKTNDKSKMFCISGWKPEPEEFVIERDGKIIELKSIGASYTQYNTVYSEESNQLYYFPCNETVDLLARSQSELDEIIFNKRGYVFIPKDNEGKSCIVNKDSDMDTKQDCNKCKIVYELVDDVERKGTCSDGDDGCICMNNEYNRSTQYVRKDKDENNKGKDEPFYLRILQKEQCSAVEPQEIPTRANRTEVFYADRLCRFDLEDLKSELRRIIKKQLEEKKQKWVSGKLTSYDFSGQNDYTDDLLKYDYVEIEAWGGGEAGHIKDKAHATESRLGMPGDYIKTKLKIDPNYPIIRVKVTEGGGGQEDFLSNKDGGPTIIEMCDSPKQNCLPLITVAGGGEYKEYGTGQDRNKYKNTIVHEQGLKLEEKIIKGDKLRSTEDNQRAYIENGEIKHKIVSKCSNSSSGKRGAGGCINKNGNNGSYSRGSPGYAIIKPMLNEIDEKKINDAIDKMIQDPNGTITIDDPLIKKLDSKIIDTIKAEIRNELSGI